MAGATYILGRSFSITRTPGSASGPNFQLAFEGIDDVLTSHFLVSRKSAISHKLTDDQSANLREEYTSARRLARCIAILDGPVYFSKLPTVEDDEREDQEHEGEEGNENGVVDSAILVFPPGSLVPSDPATSLAGDPGVVTAFISGPNSLACPDGKRWFQPPTPLLPRLMNAFI